MLLLQRHLDPFKKNEALLDILYKRPDEDFDKFCDALTECNQSHVVSKYLVTDIPSPVLYSRDVGMYLCERHAPNLF